MQILMCVLPTDGSDSWQCLRGSGYDCFAGSEHQDKIDLVARRMLGGEGKTFSFVVVRARVGGLFSE